MFKTQMSIPNITCPIHPDENVLDYIFMTILRIAPELCLEIHQQVPTPSVDPPKPYVHPDIGLLHVLFVHPKKHG